MMDAAETYKREYNRGWNASRAYGRAANPSATSPLDRTDRSDDWIDGYLDHATGRDKWHLRDCENHGVGPGTCGQG
jgi:hypothetical protein